MMAPLFISGLRHCHVKDVHSYVIRERVDDQIGMIRVFHNTGESLATLLRRDGNYSVAPHNHRQGITLYNIFGHAYNVDFDIDRQISAGGTYEYRFESEIADDGIGVYFHTTVGLYVRDMCRIDERGIQLRADSIHTVVAEPNSAWLVVEGQTTKHRTVCYSRQPGFRLDAHRLYIPMSADALWDAESLMGWKLRRLFPTMVASLQESAV